MRKLILVVVMALISITTFSQSDGDLFLAETNFYIGQMERTITLTDLSEKTIVTHAYFREAKFDKDNVHITVYFYDISDTDTVRYVPDKPIVFNSVSDATEHGAVYNTTVRDAWLSPIRAKIISERIYE